MVKSVGLGLSLLVVVTRGLEDIFMEWCVGGYDQVWYGDNAIVVGFLGECPADYVRLLVESGQRQRAPPLPIRGLF